MRESILGSHDFGAAELRTRSVQSAVQSGVSSGVENGVSTGVQNGVNSRVQSGVNSRKSSSGVDSTARTGALRCAQNDVRCGFNRSLTIRRR